MKPQLLHHGLLLLTTAMALTSAVASAQDVLPKPEPSFKGTIGETYKESKPDYPKPLQAPKGAPNVLIVLLDDVGFGHAGTFGGAVRLPRSTGSRRAGCATNNSTPPPSARPRAARCSLGATTTASPPA